MLLDLTELLKVAFLKFPIPILTNDSNSIYCQKDIIEAMKKAWSQTGNGTSCAEAGFRLDGNYADYKIIPNRYTNQCDKQSLEILPGKTFAIFHVHPNSQGGKPSTPDNNSESNKLGDTGIADKYKLDIYVMHKTGLTMYDHKTRKVVNLRNNIEWTESCKA